MERHDKKIENSSDGEPRDDFLGCGFGEFRTKTDLLQPPFEHVAKLRLPVHTELVLFVVTDRAGRESFENDLDLMFCTRISPRLGRGWEPPTQIFSERRRKFLELLGVAKNRHRCYLV